ncbi:MAG: HPr kinase/phosphatase C-terminal domain-containing protein [Pseudomonadota bacterium]
MRGAPSPDPKHREVSPAEIVHASCVAVRSQAILITGASGTGKSALALQLIGLGAELVSDDYTELRRADGEIVARSPKQIHGLIEARGVGILRAEPSKPARISLVVDLDQEETERLPPSRTIHFMDVKLPLVRKIDAAYFPASLLLYLKHGRSE